MSNGDRWMPLYVSDYLGDTMGLSTLQHGAYMLLLMHYWRSGPLPDDQQELAAIARADARTWKTAIWPKLSKFFTADGDGTLHQKRMDWERRRWTEISDKRRTAGRAGAEARYQQNPSNGRGKIIANAMANATPDDGKCHAVATTFASPPVPVQRKNLTSNSGGVLARESKPPPTAQDSTPTPPKAPLLSPSPSENSQAYRQLRSSDAFLDNPSPDDALPKADPAQVKRAVAATTYSLRKYAQAEGVKPDKTPQEQLEALEHGELLPPLQRVPQEPVRTVAEQLAALGFAPTIQHSTGD